MSVFNNYINPNSGNPDPNCKSCKGSGVMKQYDFDPEGPSYTNCDCTETE